MPLEHNLSINSVDGELSHEQLGWPSPPDRLLIERLDSHTSGTFRIVFLAMAQSGVRVNELRRLLWSNVDLSRQLLLVGTEGNRDERPREVPIESVLRSCLDQQRLVSRFNNPSNVVLSTVSGQPWAHIRFSREWQQLCRLVQAEYDLAMPGKSFFPLSHLRRNAVRRWREQGRSYKDICRWMGRYHALTGAFARDSFATK